MRLVFFSEKSFFIDVFTVFGTISLSPSHGDRYISSIALILNKNGKKQYLIQLYNYIDLVFALFHSKCLIISVFFSLEKDAHVK